MNRLSILTNEDTNGKRHVTVYISDGITITERAGTSTIKTIIRTYAAHIVSQRKLKRKIRAAEKELRAGATIVHNGQHVVSVGKVNFRVERFKSRVDGVGGRVVSQ